MAKKQDGPETHYICQLYEAKKVGRGGKVLAIKSTLSFSSPQQAEERAERAFRTGQCEGADAYRVIVDPDTGEADDPVFLARHGQVPEVETM